MHFQKNQIKQISNAFQKLKTYRKHQIKCLHHYDKLKNVQLYELLNNYIYIDLWLTYLFDIKQIVYTSNKLNLNVYSNYNKIDKNEDRKIEIKRSAIDDRHENKINN